MPSSGGNGRESDRYSDRAPGPARTMINPDSNIVGALIDLGLTRDIAAHMYHELDIRRARGRPRGSIG